MSDQVKSFGDIAKSLARNPLGFIALFIVMVYGFASLVTAFAKSFTEAERLPLIYFLVIFPFLVLGVFSWLVSRHSGKLFAPSDFKNEENYVKMQSAVILAAETKIAVQDADLEQVKALVLHGLDKRKPEGVFLTAPRDEDHAIDRTLVKMAEDYMNISVQDWAERVRIKDEFARHMANYVKINSISRDLLASQNNEGLIIALPATIQSFPEAGDISRLLKACDKVSRLHVKYAIVLAFARLFDRRLASKDDIQRVSCVLDHYERDADQPLVSRINGTRAIINQMIHESEVRDKKC